jgi:hypothetical protein
MNGVAAARFTSAPKGSTVQPVLDRARFGLTDTKLQLRNAGQSTLQHPLLHFKVVASDQVETIKKCRQQRAGVLLDIRGGRFGEDFGQLCSDFVEQARVGHRDKTG